MMWVASHLTRIIEKSEGRLDGQQADLGARRAGQTRP
jgi:hypothetical protein